MNNDDGTYTLYAGTTNPGDYITTVSVDETDGSASEFSQCQQVTDSTG